MAFYVDTHPRSLMRSPRLHLLAAAALMAGAAGCDSGCANRVITDVPSPDGHRHAVVFSRDCGATTGFSTQVSVLLVGHGPSGGGNVFVADSDHGRAPEDSGGGPVVRVRWLDGSTLDVAYDGRTRVFKREARHDDIDVRFVVDSSS